MKTNDFFLNEFKIHLSKYHYTDDISDSTQAAEMINNFYNMYIVDDMSSHISSDVIRNIIGLQPGCNKYEDINEDIRELVEDYASDLIIDTTHSAVEYYFEEYEEGNFHDNDDVQEEWNSFNEDEKRDYLYDYLTGFGYISYHDVMGYLFDSFEYIFIEKYINHLLNEAKKILKENPLVYDISSDCYYKDGKVVSDKKTPIKSYIRKYHTTQKKVLDWFKEELEYSLCDFATEETLDNEMLINALTNEIENNGYIG